MTNPEGKKYRACIVVVLFAAVSIGNGLALTQNWPTCNHDNQRSCVTSEQLELPLKEVWAFKAPHPPQPAWPPPAKQDFWHRISYLNPAVTYDRAFQLAVVGNAIYFGSSADDKVYSLDARTGRIRWSCFADGPVRLAPSVIGGKVYVGSDDGWVYCLRSADGSLLWKRKPAEKDYRLPGNGRIMSLWPIRTGVLVDGNVAYCCAGLFPAQGVYVCALDTADGTIRWKKKTDISPQGHLLASANRLFVPTGRTGPAVFDRKTGDVLGKFDTPGGTFALLTEDMLLSGPGRGSGNLQISDPQNTESIATFNGLRMIVRNEMAYLLSRHELSALNRTKYLDLLNQYKQLEKRQEDIGEHLKKLKDSDHEQIKKERDTLNGELQQIKLSLTSLKKEMGRCTIWRQPSEYPYSMILAGDTLFAGGQNKIAAFSTADGKELWNVPVTGKAYGLAVANGSLFVSTDKGTIHCFSNRPVAQTRVIRTEHVADPFPKDSLSSLYANAARHIVEQTGIKKGYCLVLGCGQGRLAYELARLTDLKIVGLEENMNNVAAARKALDQAGLYGRVVVQHGSLAKGHYVAHFANLIVSDRTLVTGKLPGLASEIFRVLRPCGGTVYLGQPSELAKKGGGLTESNIKRWLRNSSVPEWKISHDGGLWLVIRRGKLPGSGEWTHQYAGPGNTACSMDLLVRYPMSVQWFGRPGPRDMIDRHHRNVAPLYKDGRLFAPGDCVVFAVDAYNGTIQWKVTIPNSRRLGVFLDSSSMVVDDECLYVVAEDKCYGFDVHSGERRLTHTMPLLIEDEPHDWGYLAYSGDLLFGSGRKRGASYIETSRAADNALWERHMKLVASEYLFGMQRKSGTVLWTYKSGLIVNTTITLGGGRLYFVETHSPKALADKLRRMPLKTMFDGGDQYLVALDAQTGQLAYKKKIDVGNFGELVYLNYSKDVLVLSGSKAVGKTLHYSFFGIDAPTGKIRWDTTHDSGLDANGSHGEQNRHPTIVGDTVYAWPYAYNLKTGEKLAGWVFSRHGHGCGGVSASAKGLFWRGNNPWMYDLRPGGGPSRLNYVTRPGCWINIIPAGGLVLIPESSSGCTCGYPMQTSMAFAPSEIVE